MCNKFTKEQCLTALEMFGCEPDEERTNKMMHNMGISDQGWISLDELYSFVGVQ